jgi:hypothetical protein
MTLVLSEQFGNRGLRPQKKRAKRIAVEHRRSGPRAPVQLHTYREVLTGSENT